MAMGKLPGEGVYDSEVSPVSFDVSPQVMADLERLAWSHTDHEAFLSAHREHGNDLPPILDSVHMAVDGSNDPFGSFSFDSQLRLNEEYAPGGTQALQAFIRQNGGAEADSGGAYFLVSTDTPDKLWYALRLEDADEDSAITVRTLGAALRYDDQTQPSPHQSPNHSMQSVGYTIEDFLDVNEHLIAFLYGYFNVPSGEGVRLACRRALIHHVPGSAEESEVTEQPGPRFTDIGGYEDVKQMLKQVATSFQHPKLMEAYGIEQRQSGILLYGEGGTGKTTMLEALANEIGAELRVVRSSDIYSKWVGESGKNMEAVFDEAEASSNPYVLLFDELEGIVSKSGFEVSQQVASIFKQRSARLATANPKVVLAATINDRNKVDDVIIRAGRFDVKQYVPLPDSITRKQIFAHFIERHVFRAQRDVFALDIDYDQLAYCADELSGADIAAIMRAVAMKQAMQELDTACAPPPAGTEMIVAAINLHKRNLA